MSLDALRAHWDARHRHAEDTPPKAFLLEVLPDLPTTGAAVDLGCGRGAEAVALAEHGLDVLGIDASKVAIDRARAHASRHGFSGPQGTREGASGSARFAVADLSTWAVVRAFRQVVLWLHVPEFSVAATIPAVLEPGGVVVCELLTTTNFGFDAATLVEPDTVKDWFADDFDTLRFEVVEVGDVEVVRYVGRRR